MECFETSSWEHLCGRPSPSAARVVSRFKARSLPLPLSLWDFLYEKNNERSILKSHENISQYAYLQYIMLNKNNLNKISYH